MFNRCMLMIHFLRLHRYPFSSFSNVPRVGELPLLLSGVWALPYSMMGTCLCQPGAAGSRTEQISGLSSIISHSSGGCDDSWLGSGGGRHDQFPDSQTVFHLPRVFTWQKNLTHFSLKGHQSPLKRLHPQDLIEF